jgi:cbb3-type cytochrome c oxidase subunit III
MRRILCVALMGAAMFVPAAASAADGAELFKKKCASCHGEEGKGDKKPCQKYECKDFTAADWQKATADADIEKAIQDGNSEKKMPAYKEKLSAEEIKALVQQVRGLKK